MKTLTYKQKLLRFINLKASLIKKTNINIDYINDGDREDILSWPDEECKRIYEIIRENIENGFSGLYGETCPWCYRSWACSKEQCSYAQRHGVCTNSAEKNDWCRIIDGIDHETLFSNEIYKHIIFQIES